MWILDRNWIISSFPTWVCSNLSTNQPWSSTTLSFGCMSKHYIYICIYIYIYIYIHTLCSLDASHMSPRHIYTQNKVSMCLSPHLCVTDIIPVHCPNGILLDVLRVLVLICICFFRGGCITIDQALNKKLW